MGKSLGEGAKLQQSIGGVETLYTKTNRDKIKNPNLIYPNQVLTIP